MVNDNKNITGLIKVLAPIFMIEFQKQQLQEVSISHFDRDWIFEMVSLGQGGDFQSSKLLQKEAEYYFSSHFTGLHI